MNIVKPSQTDRVWFITGCSSGLGRALCEAVLHHGDAAVVTARDVRTVADLEKTFPGRAKAVRLDVTDQDSIDAAIDAAIAWKGRIDVLVNNAGFGTVGAIEEIDEDEAHIAFDANFFGVYRVIRAALPHMRKQGSGHILNVSSMIGFVGVGGFSFYSAVKFAVEGLTEALAKEMKPFGIRVTIVQPGPFRTDFRSRGMRMAPQHPAYAASLGGFRKALIETDGTQPGDPQKAAGLIIEMVNSENPPLRLPLGEVCMNAMRQKLEAVKQDIDAWEAASRATAFNR